MCCHERNSVSSDEQHEIQIHKSERSNSEKDKDIRSEEDYWEDIEPRMSKHARLLDLSKTCGAAVPL